MLLYDARGSSSAGNVSLCSAAAETTRVTGTNKPIRLMRRSAAAAILGKANSIGYFGNVTSYALSSLHPVDLCTLHTQYYYEIAMA